MAMPMPNDASTTEPASSGPRPQVTPRMPRALSPDEEAMKLMIKLIERARVATSFAKLAGGLIAATGAQASMQLRAVADAKLADVRKVARAAKEAAVHVAKRPEPETEAEPVSEEIPETVDAPAAQHAAE